MNLQPQWLSFTLTAPVGFPFENKRENLGHQMSEGIPKLITYVY